MRFGLILFLSRNGLELWSVFRASRSWRLRLMVELRWWWEIAGERVWDEKISVRCQWKDGLMAEME